MCDSNLAVCRTGIVLGVESAAVHLLYFPSFLCSLRWDFRADDRRACWKCRVGSECRGRICNIK